MNEARARITVDLTPEMRRQLKAVAAQVDMTMREFVTESLQRDLALAQRTLAEQAGVTASAQRLAAEQAPAVREAQAHMATAAAANAPQLRAVQQLTEPIHEQLARIAAQAMEAVEASQREAIEEATHKLLAQLAALRGDRQAEAEPIVEQQRAVLSEALGRVRQVYLDELLRAQQAQLTAIQQQLDPFARDWGSEEDSVYDDVE